LKVAGACSLKKEGFNNEILGAGRCWAGSCVQARELAIPKVRSNAKNVVIRFFIIVSMSLKSLMSLLHRLTVIPTKAGNHRVSVVQQSWIPACAGMSLLDFPLARE
jgi:hypothetical protein